MNKILYIVLISLFSLTVISCAKKSSDDSSSSSATTEAYKRETIPDTTTVTLPDTLTGGTTSASRTAYASLDESVGVSQVQLAVSMMKYMLINVEFNLILMDAAISQSKLSLGSCYEAGTIEISFTAEMLQALKDVYSKIDMEMSTSELSTFSAMVGTQKGNDDFPVSYATTSIRGFEKILTVGDVGATCSGATVSSIDEVMMWTDNGSKLQYTYDFSTNDGVNLGTLAYDGATKTSSYDMYLKDSTFDALVSGNFTECTSSANDCVKFRITMGTASFNLETRGKADDNGGYGLTKYISSSFDYWIKEHWDTTLKSSVYAYPCTNVTWDNISSCDFKYDYLTSYGETSDKSSLRSFETDAGKVFSQFWKATPGKTSAFLADSIGQKYALMTTAGSTNAYDIGGVGIKLDNSTVGFTLYFEPTSGDNFTMQDLSISASNTRSISSTVVDNLTLTYTNPTELEGRWVTSCVASDYYYLITTIAVSGTNVTNKYEFHSDSSCANDSYSEDSTYSSLSIGDEYTDDGYGSSGGSGHRFTMTIDTNTYTSLSASDVTWNNSNSWCGETDWVLNTPQSIAGKTCGSTAAWNTNITIYGLYMFDGNKLFRNFTSGSYPSSNNVGDNDVFTKQ
jgi:hypothetical protein